jgi:predicted TIM-barrel fold metal-dependent hydrolase
MLAPMALFPRPVSPKSALSDLMDMLSGPLPHKWPLLLLSMTLTGVMIWAFDHDARAPKPERQIIYVESWMKDRKDSAIIVQQKKDLAAYEVALERKQKEFQSVADKLGIEWRADEARNKARRLAIIAAVNKQLDQRIAVAKSREAGAGQDSPPK